MSTNKSVKILEELKSLATDVTLTYDYACLKGHFIYACLKGHFIVVVSAEDFRNIKDKLDLGEQKIPNLGGLEFHKKEVKNRDGKEEIDDKGN